MSERPRGYNDADMFHSVREFARWLGVGVVPAKNIAEFHNLWRLIPGTSKRVIPVQAARQRLGLTIDTQPTAAMGTGRVPIPRAERRWDVSDQDYAGDL